MAKNSSSSNKDTRAARSSSFSSGTKELPPFLLLLLVSPLLGLVPFFKPRLGEDDGDERAAPDGDVTGDETTALSNSDEGFSSGGCGSGLLPGLSLTEVVVVVVVLVVVSPCGLNSICMTGVPVDVGGKPFSVG